jgi:ABC-2 type transport system ATP-binding protein
MIDDDLPSHPAIVTTALTKQYSRSLALADLSLTVETGTIFGFLGPNGAGKTTTIRLLLGFIAPSRGGAAIFGHDAWRDGVAARRYVGYLVPSEAFYPEMTGRSQLDYAARLSGGKSALRRELLDLLELAERDLDRPFGEYSKGMKQKLALTAAAQHDPPLLILDEPTDGLDPLIQRRYLDFLRAFHARGRTIFMSSHDLTEVERVCEQVAIVRDGRLVAHESIERIRGMHLRRVEILFAGTPPLGLESVGDVAVVAANGKRWTLTVEGPIDPLIGFLAGTGVEDMTIVPPSLDDVFISYYDAHPANPNRLAEVSR